MPSTNSKKRKLDAGMQKFYAVRAGMRPGIYLTWPECQKQIAGFKGAQFKSFTSRDDAAAFVAGKDIKSTSDAEPRFYAVAVGTKPGIYTDWPTAQLAILGAKGPKYKRFGTRPEAEAYVRMFGSAAAKAALTGGQAAMGQQQEEEEDDDDDDDDDDEEEEDEVDDDEEEDEVELDEQVLEPVAKRAKTTTTAPQGMLQIYTDGSSLANGKVGAAAGVGVYFGAGDPRNISEPLAGDVQTNQRAELTAILRALQTIGVRQGAQLVSDSKYSISCVTEWYVGWQRNGWRTRDGPVKNKDLVQAVREVIEARDAAGTPTMFKWVKGHAGDAGNVAADQLAVAGARKMRR